MSIADTFKIVGLEDEIKQLRMAVTTLRNGVEAALICMADDDYQEACSILEQFLE